MLGFGKRQDLYDSLFGPNAARWEAPAPAPAAVPAAEQSIPVVEFSALVPAPVRFSYDDGTKFLGGYGPTELLLTDYWTLRARSAQLFQTNLYARGLVRRLVTNEINTGLHLEATPEESILGVPEDSLSEWSEMVENRFHLWESDPALCDQTEQNTFGALQALARMEALVDGDVLVVLGQDQRTGLPRVRLVNGASVQTPFPRPNRPGVRIIEGVELDSLNRQVAYWIRQPDGKSKRLPAYGEKSGRRLAWLVYGTDKRLNDVRGIPILGLVLQSLREIDRYRDSTQRKAVLNSMLAMFIKKTEDKPGTRPITGGGGALRRSGIEMVEGGATPRAYRTAELIPGLVLDELQTGEEPAAFPSNGTDERFGTFEEAIIQAVAWANEIPPEILTLSFTNNYSASQAAINEFKMYLNKVRTAFGQNFCQPIYVDWLLSEALSRRVNAPRFLEAWRNPSQYDVLGAWTAADWAGHIKPAVDLSKLVGGYKEMVEGGFITRDRASRELTGTKYSKNVQKLKRENEALADANKLIADLTARSKTRLAGAVPDDDEDQVVKDKPKRLPPKAS